MNHLGKSLLKEVYDFVHNNDYPFLEEIRDLQKNFLKILTKKNINILDNVDIELIYEVMDEFDFNKEIGEDLYFLKKSFLDIYRVFDFGYIYLNH